MKYKNNKKALSILFTSLLFLLITIFSFKCAVVNAIVNTGLETSANEAGLATTGNQDVVTIVGNIVGYALYFTGAIFFILILIAGFTWMTAGGDEKKISSAKAKIKGAIMGIIVILCAYVITNFVFETLKTTIETTPAETTPPAP